MFHRKFISILLILLSVIALTIGCTEYYLNKVTATSALEGAIDLTAYNWERGDVIPLVGEWEFYWRELLAPDDFKGTNKLDPQYFNMPGLWNGYEINNEKITEEGYGTFRLKINSIPGKEMALRIPYACSAYKLWWNGKVVSTNGVVGKTKDVVEMRRIPRVVNLPTWEKNNELILQIANFNYYIGGMNKPILVGEEEKIHLREKISTLSDMFIFSCLFISAFFFLGLYSLRRREKMSLYFGLVCILLGLRALLINEVLLAQAFPNVSWEILNRLQDCGIYIGVPCLFLFYCEMYPEEIPAKFKFFWSKSIPIFALFLIVSPFKLYDKFLPVFYFLLILSGLYLLVVIMKAVKAKKTGAFLNFIVGIVFFITGVNDILYSENVISTAYIVNYSMLIFIFVQAFILEMRYVEAFEKNEKLAIENAEMNKSLNILNEGLEKTIEERTKELKIANNKLKNLSMMDGLTKINNRRAFDVKLKYEYRQGLTEPSYLSIILIDIDFYKQFNDNYGHLAGDACIKKVAQTLANSVNRISDFVARYGGDEFVIILPSTDARGVVVVAERIRQRIEKLAVPHAYSPISPNITVSIGATTVKLNEEIAISKIMEEADKALYQAKAKGRNQVFAKTML